MKEQIVYNINGHDSEEKDSVGFVSDQRLYKLEGGDQEN